MIRGQGDDSLEEKVGLPEFLNTLTPNTELELHLAHWSTRAQELSKLKTREGTWEFGDDRDVIVQEISRAESGRDLWLLIEQLNLMFKALDPRSQEPQSSNEFSRRAKVATARKEMAPQVWVLDWLERIAKLNAPAMPAPVSAESAFPSATLRESKPSTKLLGVDHRGRQGESDKQVMVLHKMDQRQEEILVNYIWAYVIAGEMDQAQKVCRAFHQHWRAATLVGGQLWHSQQAPGQSTPLGQVSGNRRRALWRQMCNKLAKASGVSQRERALYAALGGDVDTALLGCKSWKEELWVMVKALTECQYDARLAQLEGEPPCPSESWKNYSVGDLFSQLEARHVNLAQDHVYILFKSLITGERRTKVALNGMDPVIAVHAWCLINTWLKRKDEPLSTHFDSEVEASSKPREWQKLGDLLVKNYITFLCKKRLFSQIVPYLSLLSSEQSQISAYSACFSSASPDAWDVLLKQMPFGHNNLRITMLSFAKIIASTHSIEQDESRMELQLKALEKFGNIVAVDDLKQLLHPVRNQPVLLDFDPLRELERTLCTLVKWDRLGYLRPFFTALHRSTFATEFSGWLLFAAIMGKYEDWLAEVQFRRTTNGTRELLDLFAAWTPEVDREFLKVPPPGEDFSMVRDKCRSFMYFSLAQVMKTLGIPEERAPQCYGLFAQSKILNY